MGKDQIAIEVDELFFGYEKGDEVIRGVSFRVYSGEKVGLIGPNAAGKTTLLLLLNGLLQGRGRIRIFGKEVERSSLMEIRKLVGLVFQEPDHQLFCARIFDDIAFGPLNMGFSREEVLKAVERALKEVGLGDIGSKSPEKLSSGEKKRAAIATVLSYQPPIILFDEPTANLDPKGRSEIIALIRNLDRTMIIATHDLDLVKKCCDRAMILNQGKIVASGNSTTILSDIPILKQNSLYME